MEIKPDYIGKKCLYLNPSEVSFTSAELALIDTAINPVVANISPYGYTSTVRDDYDTVRIVSAATNTAVVAANRASFGLFLSPENDKKNFLFQVTGTVRWTMTAAAGVYTNLQAGFFFGRKATNNTVTSSKAGVNNTLEKVMFLPPTSYNFSPITWDVSVPEPVGGPSLICGIESEIFTLAEADKFVYCFGACLENCGSNNVNGIFDISLSVRKYGKNLATYNPGA